MWAGTRAGTNATPKSPPRSVQRDLTSGGWKYLLLFVPGVSLSLFGRALDRSMSQNIAVAAFGVALFLGAAWLHARTARRLQAEIDVLAS